MGTTMNGDGDGVPWFAGRGETRSLMRALEGERGFGPRSTWPSTLHIVLDIVVSADVPMALFWGPESRMLYNDRFASLLGSCHPDAFGRPAAGVLGPNWDAVEPMLLHVRVSRAGHNARTYLPAANDRAPASIDTSYVPIHDGCADLVVGVLAIFTVSRMRTPTSETLRMPRIDEGEAQFGARGSSPDLVKKR